MQPRIINCVGKKVHDYVFVKELGKGAFGMVRLSLICRSFLRGTPKPKRLWPSSAYLDLN